jgi:hypothetical protein
MHYLLYWWVILLCCQSLDNIASNGKMSDDLKRIWTEAVAVLSKNYTGICVEGLRKTLRIADVPTNFRIRVRDVTATSTCSVKSCQIYSIVCEVFLLYILSDKVIVQMKALDK